MIWREGEKGNKEEEEKCEIKLENWEEYQEEENLDKKKKVKERGDEKHQ